MQMNKKRKLLAALLAVFMLVQTYINIPSVAAEEGNYESATSHGFASLNGIHIDQNSSLVDNGDGTYSLSIQLKSAYTKEAANTETFLAKNGTYTVSREGWYLIELFGGAGAGVSGAGTGGAAGHVYAKVYLTEGQTLYYSLGGNGVATQKTDTGGGANGDGGGHGLVGNYTVGGGGGYSAVFLYDEGEFEEKYTTLRAGTISEADRISKYIMIAGGGGGGGAEPGSGTVVGTADGGAGGYVGGANGTVSGDHVVSGYYFSGENGKSAGTSTSYIGKGGTYEPGASGDSLLGLTQAESTPPDDWFGSVRGAGGAGGSGELRGGGGGAGYAGGSGGLMTSALISSNVGGGGGGSSFLASTVNNKNTVYENTDDFEAFLVPTAPTTGGAMYVTFLDENDFSFLQGLELEACFSEYAVPVSATFTVSDTANSAITLEQNVVDAEHSHEKVVIKNASLLDGGGNVGGEIHISVTFTYGDGFLGGNNVNILNQHDTAYYAPITVTATNGDQTVVDLGQECGYVNMPLRIHAHAHSQEMNSPGTEITVDSLFYDEFALPYAHDEEGNSLGSIRDNLAILTDPNHSNSYQYDHILEIGEYRVYDSSGNLLGEETIAPNHTTTYTVALPIRIIQTGYAEVGEPIVTDKDGWVVLTSVATVTVPGSRYELLGKFMVTYTKSMVYEPTENTYTYTLKIQSTAHERHSLDPDTPGINHVVDYDPNNPVIEYEHTIEVDGCYLIQVWGGNGGKGGNGMFGWSEGGVGGAGGYVSGYVDLQKGDTIEIFVGMNGTDASGAFSTGTGGKHSRVSLIHQDGTQEVLMIAGGGGGGGYGFGNDGSAGGAVETTVQGGTVESGNEYEAYDGVSGSNRNGGSAGKNYISSRVKTDPTSLEGDAANRFAQANQTDYSASVGAGTTYVKCLEIAESSIQDVVQEIQDALTDYGVALSVSKYFKVDNVTLNGVASAKHGENVYTATDKTISEIDYVSGEDTPISIVNIIPDVVTNSTEGGTINTATIDFDIVIQLSPAEGFMGGNDVPLFVNDAISLSHVQYTEDESKNLVENSPDPIVLGANDAADYANVVIDYQPPVLEAKKLFYQQGDEGYGRDDLYEVTGDIPVAPDAGADNAWCYKYVTVVNTVTDSLTGLEVTEAEVLTPTHTTEYAIKIGIAPSANASKAVTTASQTEKVATGNAIIIVGHEVIFDELSNLSHSMDDLHGKYVVEQGKDLEFTLTPTDETVYRLPASITIKIGSTVLDESQYSYDKVGGTVFVDKNLITDDVHVEASARRKEYTIHYVYGLTPDTTEYVTKEQTFEAGTSITGAFHNDTEKHPDVPGYDFSWDWGEGVEEAPTTMPANDLWVIGTFTPHVYTVTIHYVYEDGGEQVAPDYVGSFKHGELYAVGAPEIKGYLPYVGETLTTTVQGTVNAANVEVTVKYKPTQNTLTVIYKNAKTGEQVGNAEIHTVSGDSYGGIQVKTLPGYTQSRDGINKDATWVEISGSISEGSTVFVYYLPNTYTVRFIVDGKEIATREAVFGEMYGYNADGDYEAFVYPSVDHYTFEGWYLDTQKIDEETIVNTAENHDIVAKMVPDVFTVTVKYQNEDGSAVADDIVGEFDYGDAYSFVSPTIEGYTPDKAVVEGTVLGHNIIVIVTYTYNYPTDPVISTEITWGAKTLQYSFVPGKWDPETHSYGEDRFDPVTPGANTISVTNVDSYVYIDSVKTPIQIIAGFSYQSEEGYEDISAYFTTGEAADADRVNRITVSCSETGTVYVWIEGEFTPGEAGQYGVGTCTVTIQGGAQQNDQTEP